MGHLAARVAACLLLFVVVFSAVPVFSQEADGRPADLAAAALPTRTFAPTLTPRETGELPNPDRGQYVWYGNQTDPSGWPWMDSYTRLTWRELEPLSDVYDFSTIDRELASAASHGGRFGFRVMTVDSYQGGSLVPDYIVNGSNGFWHQAEAGRPRTFLPDWNSATYIGRFTALMRALGQRYATDPRLAYVDIGGFGNYGEWHVYPFENAYPGPNNQTAVSNASAAQLVDATVDAFPGRILMMPTAHEAALTHALHRSPSVGLRVDCLGGSPSMFGATDHIKSVAAAQTRWKTAPFVTEWCGNATPESGVFITGANQVAEFHVSSLSSGNYAKPWTRFSQRERDAYVHAVMSSGYRLAVDRLTVPTVALRGQTLNATTQWQNSNVAPTYRDWRTVIQLRDLSGRVATQFTSAVDLRHVMPASADAPLVHDDVFSIPGSVTPGTYDIAVQVLDPSGISAPMRLAMPGRAEDGSYVLGSIAIQ